MTDDNIVDLPCETSLPLQPDKILQNAVGTGIDEIALLYLDANGEFQMCTSEPDMARNLMLVELARKRLVDELGSRFDM